MADFGCNPDSLQYFWNIGAAGAPTRSAADALLVELREIRDAGSPQDRGLKRRIVQWKQRTHIPKLLPAGPLAGAVPALQADPHRNHPKLYPSAIDELHVVDRALGRQGIDRDAELLRQNLCERFAINVLHAAR